jgi:hypothetical protein
MDLVKVKVIEKVGYAATVVSVLPWDLHERKPGVYPGEFFIKGVDDPNLELTVLGIDESVYYVPLALDRPSFPVRAPAIEIAASIVNDYCNSILAATAVAHPGMFAVNAPLMEADVIDEYAAELHEARESQNMWMERLVRIADDDWQRYQQHKVVSDIQRRAAKVLNLEREWAKDLTMDRMNKCPSCKAVIDPLAIVCSNCNFVIDEKQHELIKHRYATK